MSSLNEFKTREEELPLIYINPLSGNRLLFTWLVNDNKKKVPGQYIFVEQDEKENIISKGVLKGLKNVNEMRNNAIKEGWKFFHLPKIDIKGVDGKILQAPKIEERPKRKKKSRVFAARRRNPTETFEEMKERMKKQIIR